ncbi:MAG: hypothetical protein NXI08_08245 [bacterium]|nr:hypothetical protein [bacterium]
MNKGLVLLLVAFCFGISTQQDNTPYCLIDGYYKMEQLLEPAYAFVHGMEWVEIELVVRPSTYTGNPATDTVVVVKMPGSDLYRVSGNLVAFKIPECTWLTDPDTVLLVLAGQGKGYVEPFID